ncbi:serine proteinase [Pilatotrama ljubarskyi]|nr:serine proteinase [Pilatotrama ljubarskyi]
MTIGSQASQRALPIEVWRTAGVKKEGSYIVLLKPSVDKAAFLAWLKQLLTGNSVITHDYPADFSNSFAGLFDEESLALLRSSADVERISEDAVSDELSVLAVEEDTSWNLNRLSQRSKLTFKYGYEREALGKDVDIYIVDTGINVDHVEFDGRAKWGWVAPGLPQIDDVGHGTQVAGIAAGKRWGIAKKANLIAVKTHNEEMTATVADVKAGMSYIWTVSKGRISVVNMSFGFTPAEPEIDEGVAKFTARGIHVCAAAGNKGTDAKDTTPARAPTAITVGAMGPDDRRRISSNYGSVVDLFAPGSSVTTASIGSNTALADFSGTSAACPHVAGLAAAFVSYFGDTGAAKIKELIRQAATPDILADIPEGTPNLLAYNLCR